MVKNRELRQKRSLFDLVNSQIWISVAFEILKGISSQLPFAFLTLRWIVFVCNCQLIILGAIKSSSVWIKCQISNNMVETMQKAQSYAIAKLR